MGIRVTERIIFAVVVLAALMACSLAHSEELGQVNQTALDGWVLSGTEGLIGVNMAAGDQHVQANVRLVGIDGSVSRGLLSQATESGGNTPLAAYNVIGGHAGSRVSGVVSINQAAGTGTAESNVLLLGLGVAAEQLDPYALEQTVGSQSSAPTTSGEAFDIIEGRAFEGSRGVIQVNQSAGAANAVSNNAAITIRCTNL